MSIAQNIKMLRGAYNLSQKDIGSIAGVSDKAVSTWESGIKEPRMGALQKLADHFGILKSNIIEDGGLDDFLSKKQEVLEIIPEGKYQDIVELLDQLNAEQVAEVRGYIKRIVSENNAAAETAKQINAELA